MAAALVAAVGCSDGKGANANAGAGGHGGGAGTGGGGDSSGGTGGTMYHANSISYRAADDTYIVGDLGAVGYAKLTRSGTRVWRFVSNDLVGNHGHHLLDDSIVVFKARMTPSLVDEFRLTVSSGSATGTRIWSYDPGGSLWTAALGDVQRLPNADTLIDYSLGGEMREISPAGDVVQTIQVSSQSGTKGQFGYADFRPTLYGPPLR